MRHPVSHPRAFSGGTFILLALLSVFGAIIGIQLLVSLGVTPNTSIIGALVAMILARIPLALFARFRSIHEQNLAQSAISSATFGAANSLLLPIAIPYLFGRTDLVLPMFAGVAAAMLLDGYLLYRLFDSRVFPAAGAWPPGVAAAEAIKAGDTGGRQARLLGAGIGVGLVGAWLHIPMSAFGTAFLGNIWALTMFGIGLLIRGYAKPLMGWDINALYIPHGLMIGAGLVALIQVIAQIRSRGAEGGTGRAHEGAAPVTTIGARTGTGTGTGTDTGIDTDTGISARTGTGARTGIGTGTGTGTGCANGDGNAGTFGAAATMQAAPAAGPTRTVQDMRRTLRLGAIAYIVLAALLALGSGLYTGMSTPMLVGFIAYAAFAAFVHELLVGIAAMHSGWFPAFAVALITLLVGMLIGFPPVALVILCGFAAATGPAFADMGYDLKAGYLLRGNGSDPAFELDGRRQQLAAGMLAFVISIPMVYFTYHSYFDQGLTPPVAAVYVATIKAGVAPGVATQLLIWAIPGALVQWLGGPRRQLGVLLSTGLLIANPLAGWAVLAGIALRILALRVWGDKVRNSLEVFAAGTIAGDALYSFFNSLIQYQAKR